MEIIQIQQITQNDIRDVIKEELKNFFTNNKLDISQNEKENYGDIDLAVKITGLAKPTIYSLCSKRKIPHSKKGKRLYFSKKELIEWIAKGKRKTQNEIASEAKNYLENKTRVNTATNE